MTICNDHDAEVCYESRDCPACELKAALTKAEEKIGDLETEVESLKEEIKNNTL